MNLISDILFWISNGLLVPVVVLLIILFIRSLLLILALVMKWDLTRGLFPVQETLS